MQRVAEFTPSRLSPVGARDPAKEPGRLLVRILSESGRGLEEQPFLAVPEDASRAVAGRSGRECSLPPGRYRIRFPGNDCLQRHGATAATEVPPGMLEEVSISLPIDVASLIVEVATFDGEPVPNVTMAVSDAVTNEFITSFVTALRTIRIVIPLQTGRARGPLAWRHHGMSASQEVELAADDAEQPTRVALTMRPR